MGWANCGEDSEGRPIGYAHEATCDHPGCKEQIDRGLAWVCGRHMHGEDDVSCEKYFCERHVGSPLVPDSVVDLFDDSRAISLCLDCRKVIEAYWRKGTFNTDIPKEDWPENYDDPSFVIESQSS